jgi:subfamily B ATP-binding cassette protein MsbA
VLAIIAMVIFGATDGVVPFLVKYVLDGVFTHQDKTLLWVLPLALFAFGVVRGIVDFGQSFMMSKVGLGIVRDLRNEVHAHLLKLSNDFYVFRSSADLVSRVTSDVLLVRTLLTDAAAAVIRDSIRVVALLAAAIYLDPTLALIAAVVFPLGIYPVYRFGRRMRKLSRVGQEATGKLSAVMQESTLGNRVVKIFGREDFEHQRFQRENDRLTETFIKAERVKALTGPVNEVLATAVIGGVILYGGYSVMQDLRTQGEFLAFLISVFLLYDPFKKLSRISSTVQQGVAGAERLFEILDTKPSITDPAEPVSLGSGTAIEFQGVDFSYAARPTTANLASADLEISQDEDEEPRALSNINLRIEEGQKVALVGFSGAGKSTLVDLIMRFIDPQRGVVRMGGVDVSSLRLKDLRRQIAMVNQHTFLFHDTIFNNIAYGLPDATREQVISAAKAAYAYDFIMQLPLGFESIIGESGFTLSGGERQRLAIARAILKNAPILVLDEATASLDNRAEREVQSALEALERGRTTIVIAHRLSTVRNADNIVVLKDGRIVEMGTHEELLARGGEFAKLYALQFSEEAPQEDTVVN